MSISVNIFTEVRAALRTAVELVDDGSPRARFHSRRSQAFVSALAERLRNLYRPDPEVAVFSRAFDGLRGRFGLNELLLDVLVCRTAETSSATGRAQLSIITDCLVGIESEFARDSREALYDFNKLAVCTAAVKLFIGPRVTDESSFLSPLAAAAAHCAGRVLVALVPHPEEWTTGAHLAISAYEWENGAWAKQADANANVA